MSVIVRDTSTRVITLYCKGADSVIFTKLSSQSLEFQATTQDHLDHYARLGLRTLCLSKRVRNELRDDYINYMYMENDLTALKINDVICIIILRPDIIYIKQIIMLINMI